MLGDKSIWTITGKAWISNILWINGLSWRRNLLSNFSNYLHVFRPFEPGCSKFFLGQALCLSGTWLIEHEEGVRQTFWRQTAYWNLHVYILIKMFICQIFRTWIFVTAKWGQYLARPQTRVLWAELQNGVLTIFI